MKKFALVSLFNRAAPEIPVVLAAKHQKDAKAQALTYFEQEQPEWSTTALENDYQKLWYVLALPGLVEKCFVETRLPGFRWTKRECNDYVPGKGFLPYDNTDDAEAAIERLKALDDPAWKTAQFRIVPK